MTYLKNILGLDLGTNSIGWALIRQTESNSKILAAGCRIIPMTQDELSNFDKGQSISATAERTRLRTMRRIRERQLQRRERLHRVLNILGFLPEHYATKIDFHQRLGQFLPGTEPKIAFSLSPENKHVFHFMTSFQEMLNDFTIHQPHLIEGNKSIPFNWTIYYLRKKALSEKISKEELAWLLLHFNQKRGYNQLREEEEETNPLKTVEYRSLLVNKVVEEEKKKEETWYAIHLQNGLIYKRSSKTPLNWEGTYRDFIISTELNDDGSVKTDKFGNEKISLRSPSADDWTLLKKKAEADLDKSKKTPGSYIYEALLQNPSQKIRGKLISVVERKYYKEELLQILRKQVQFHPELSDSHLLLDCLEELYPHNLQHRNYLQTKDFTHLFIEDILYYQRPLKTKKSQIRNCRFEYRPFVKDGILCKSPLKCIPVSHPLFQEFRLWNFVQNLRIIQKEKKDNGQIIFDADVTNELLPGKSQKAALFEWLNERKEVDEKSLLKYPGFQLGKETNKYRWNYASDKKIPANETRFAIKRRLREIIPEAEGFLTREKEIELWHILYSVESRADLQKALNTFALKNQFGPNFVEQFRKFPSFEKDYAAYSQKALNKLLPLLRAGKYWNETHINADVHQKIGKLLNAEADDSISETVREKTNNYNSIEDFSGLPEWLATSIVYNRHAESNESNRWETPSDIELIPQHQLRNPTVEKIVNETLRVVRDLWIQYGNSEPGFFHEIHVELGREMKNPIEERKRINEQNKLNENTNLRLKALLQELLQDGSIENVRPFSPAQLEILRIYEEGSLSKGNIPDDISIISKLAQPNQQQLLKYKLWLQQQYRSPYTGAIIPLNKLFTREYDIEHIIPQSRFFDDSFSNKVICERIINSDYKGNQLAYEFIRKNAGRKVPELSTDQKQVTIFTLEEYEDFVKSNYSTQRGKLKRLIMEEIPESFIQRQLNDSRYISKLVKNLLSNIVRQEGEKETTAKNLIVSNGAITSTLKQHWGLNDIWNTLITPRFERLNEITKSTQFGHWTNKEGKQVFQTQVPLLLQKSFSRKRIDHRHHALDAIIVACTTRNHVSFMNNEHAAANGQIRHDLRVLLCEKNIFKKPWEEFTQEAKTILSDIIPSFRQQLRIAEKARNLHQVWRKDTEGNLKKIMIRQESHQHWSIRKPLHKDTVAGRVEILERRFVPILKALQQWKDIADKPLRNLIQKLVAEGYDDKQLLQYFKNLNNNWNGKDVSKVELFYRNDNYVATRKELDETFNQTKIEKVTSPVIRRILQSHLALFNDGSDGKIIEQPEKAFSPDGIEEMNRNIRVHNGGKQHAPIFKVRLSEPIGNKFKVGQSSNSEHKYVEAEKGTNLFFGIYKNAKGKRIAETIPLNIAIERKKQNLPPVPELNADGDPLIFSLSPNDLVYIPDEEEIQEGKIHLPLPLDPSQTRKIYKIVSFTGNRLMAIPCQVARPVVDGLEFTKLNKLEIALNGMSIKETCVKLLLDRLGRVKQIIQ